MKLKLKEEKIRSIKQNSALHLYFRLVAEAMNAGGLDLQHSLPPVDVPLNEHIVKEVIWKPIMKLVLDKKSTTEHTTKDIDEVFEIMNRFLANKGIHEAFPSIDELSRNLD